MCKISVSAVDFSYVSTSSAFCILRCICTCVLIQLKDKGRLHNLNKTPFIGIRRFICQVIRLKITRSEADEVVIVDKNSRQVCLFVAAPNHFSLFHFPELLLPTRNLFTDICRDK